MNKYILGGVGVIIVIATIVLIKTDRPIREETSAEKTAETTSATVTYTNDGFAPAELTVKAGTTVTFINQSGSPMWVASAPHPTHTLYPEFDEKASVTKGGSYSFTFDKVGTHPYHNHLHPSNYGKIIVE